MLFRSGFNLISLGEGAIPYLPALLRAKEEDVRSQAVEIIRQHGAGEIAIDPAALIADRCWRVREGASGALVKILGREATPWLTKLAKDSDSGVRGAAVSALAQIGDADAMVPFLKDDNPLVRATAVHQLGTVLKRDRKSVV